MKTHLLLITLFLSSMELIASERNVTQANGQYVAVGYSENLSEVARDESCNNAKRELISYLFGVQVRVTQNSIRTLDKLDLSSAITVNSEFIKLKGITNDTTKNASQTKCIIHYPVTEAKTEQERIEKIRKTLANKKLNRASFENADLDRFGTLTIRSNVHSAKVFIDSTFWGQTPLMVDRVPIGKHDISINADNYTPESQSVEVGLGETKEVNFTLSKNKVGLHFEIMPVAANYTLFINGIAYKKSDQIKLDPGQYIVRVEAPNYFSYQDKFEFKAGANLSHRVELNPKPVPVSFISQSEETTVYLNGNAIGKSPITRELQIGTYQVDFINSTQGIIESKTIVVLLGTPLKVEAAKKITKTTAPVFKNVMIYKDTNLSVSTGYVSRDEAPRINTRSSQMVDLELVNPSEGFIYINNKLAGKKIVQIDNLDGEFPVKLEAPGYYADEVKLFAINAKTSIEVLGNDCIKKKDQSFLSKIIRGIFPKGFTNPDYEYIRFGGDNFKTYHYCWDSVEANPWQHYMFPIGEDTLNLVELKFNLFKKVSTVEGIKTADAGIDKVLACVDAEKETKEFTKNLPSNRDEISAGFLKIANKMPDEDASGGCKLLKNGLTLWASGANENLTNYKKVSAGSENVKQAIRALEDYLTKYNNEKQKISDGTICCGETLATLIFAESKRYFLEKNNLPNWLSKRYPGLKFFKYKRGFLQNSIYVTYIPKSYGKIPAIVQYPGIRGYDLKLPNNIDGFSSTLLFSEVADFKVSDRVIVIVDMNDSLTKNLRDLDLKDDFSYSVLDIQQKNDHGLAAQREQSLKEGKRYGQ